MNGRLSQCIRVIAAIGAATWLFGDTLRHYIDRADSDDAIRFAYWGGYEDHVLWTEVVEAFHRHEPTIRIRQEWLPLSGYLAKIDQQLVAGAAPDVFMFQDEPFPRYAESQFLNLDPLFTADNEAAGCLDDCWPTAVASFRDGAGAMRGAPLHGGNVLIYCNPDAFERASRFHHRTIALPEDDWTLDEFVATCRDLTIDENGDGEPEQFGLLQPHWVYYLPFIWSHGAALLDESHSHWTLTGPAAVAAFQFYADLRHRHHVTPSPMEYAGQNSDSAFLSGRVAMCVNGPWYMPYLNETHLRDRYRVVGIPSGAAPSRTRVTWDALCVNAAIDTATREKAWRFVRFTLSDEAQTIFARRQRAIPARRAIGERFIAFGGGPASPAAAFIDAMATARMQPITKDWLPMDAVVRRHLLSVIPDGAARRSAEAAVDALANERVIRETFGGGE